MKKILLTLTVIAGLTVTANAQTEKGKIMVGGLIEFQNSKIKDLDYKVNRFSINPTAGYFISDNWALGTSIGYTWDKSDNGQNYGSEKDEFQVAPFVRKYTVNGPVRFFAQLSIPMAWGTETTKSNNVEVKNKIENYGIELAPGIAYFPTSKIGVELKVRGLYYKYRNNKTKDEARTDFGLHANSLAPTLGVQFYF